MISRDKLKNRIKALYPASDIMFIPFAGISMNIIGNYLHLPGSKTTLMKQLLFSSDHLNKILYFYTN